MKIRSSVFATLALALTIGCNVSYVPPVEEDAGMRQQPPADSGTQPPPADSGTRPPADSGPVCNGANLQTDVANCGVCNRACAAGQLCGGGECITPVVPPTCNGANLQTDVNNCGTCNNRCSTGDSCTNGMCVGNAYDTYEITASAPRTVDSIDVNDYWSGEHAVGNYLDPMFVGRPFTAYTATIRVPRNAWVELNALFTFPEGSGIDAAFACGIQTRGGPFTTYGQFMVRRNGGMIVMVRTASNNRKGCNFVAADRTRPAT